MVGLSITKNKFEKLTNQNNTEIVKTNKKTPTKTKDFSEKNIDSIKKQVNDQMEKSFIPIPEEVKKNVMEGIENEANDSTKVVEYKDLNFSIVGIESLEKLSLFNKKNPDIPMDKTLDTLKYKKNFTNRFLFTRVKAMNTLTKSEDGQKQFFSQVLSYGSVALFILLPFFTLFLKLFYVRGKFTYVDHLIFVFHVQTVFFMLFSIFFILEIFGVKPSNGIYMLLFLIYLFIAMKKFYNQGYFKTFTKFILLNISYLIVASIGIIFVFVISFALL